MISASPRAASRAYRPPRWALCQAPQSSATRPKGGSPCQKRRLVGPQTTVGRTPIKPAKPSSLDSAQQRDQIQGANAAHQSSVVGMLAESSSTASLHKCSDPRVQRSLAARQKPSCQRCAHARPATPRGGSERPRTRAPTPPTQHAQERPAKTRKKLTARPPQVSHRNHSAPQTIVVVRKASCVRSTTLKQNGSPSVE